MKISTKGRHAITAMMELALHDQKGPVTLAGISAEQSISVSYLEQLFARLRAAGLVTGMRGPGGGYRLRRTAREISVAEILRAIDDSLQNAGQEVTQDVNSPSDSLALWGRLSHRIYDYLDGISLAETIDREHETGGPDSPPGFHRSAA